MRHHRLLLSLASAACLIALAAPAKADLLENLTFTGTATCLDANCASFGTGPVFGTFEWDVTTQAVVGAWSFSTPLGVMSSTMAGSAIDAGVRFGDIDVAFEESTPYEFIQLFFPGSDTDMTGPLATNVNSDACTPASAISCFPDYIVTGSNQLAPEPSSMALLFGAIGAVTLLGRKKLIGGY